jgi:ATP-binding protein involved in chromosome partitioning
MPRRPTPQDVLDVLSRVVDPELGGDIVSLGMVGDVSIEDGVVSVPVALTTSGCPLRAQIRDDAIRMVNSIAGVRHVRVTFSEMSAAQRALVMERARARAQTMAPVTFIPDTARVIACASGKGGVGKSSVAASIAWELACRGFCVGVIDGDVLGFSIPRLLGVTERLVGRPRTPAERHVDSQNRRVASATDSGRAEEDNTGLSAAGMLIPAEVPLAGGRPGGRLQVVSAGLLLDGTDVALMWRGSMLSRALQHFVEDVDWSGIDYLIVDLPPGTGDVPMSLARLLPRADLVVVTTPSPNATDVAVRVADMARRSNIRVAGIVENMGASACPHGETMEFFGPSRAADVSKQLRVPVLGVIPFSPRFAQAELVAKPALTVDVGYPDGVVEAFGEIVHGIVDSVTPPVDVSSCTSRILRRLEGLGL